MTRTAEQRPGPRWVLPAEDDLIRAIGRAVYGFAQFERSMERAREALDGPPGGRFDGGAAEDAAPALEGAADEPAAQLLRILVLYRGLEERRDGLLRARPHGADGDARGPGVAGGASACAWRTEDILRMARDFEAAAIEANRLLRRHL